MGFEETWVYDAIEFVAFIVARILQFVLGTMTQLSLISDDLANNFYHGFSYLIALTLLIWSLTIAKSTVYKGSILINRQTSLILLLVLAIQMMAAFTAAAPTTGLSLKYCAKAVAGFVKF